MLNVYRSRLLASTLLVGAAVIAHPALAQTADPASQPKTGVQSTDPSAPAAGISSQESAPPAGDNSTGDIVVTGTLIRNPNLISSSPVSVIGAEEQALRQRNTAEELLRDLPGVAPSIGSAVNNGNGGAAYVDLRGLGNFRNVVLLDGTRITPASSVGRVDLKADRITNTLHVGGAFAEDGHRHSQVAAALAGELRAMASWLGLDDVSVGERGDLVTELRRSLG